jgi:hypothetical protein
MDKTLNEKLEAILTIAMSEKKPSLTNGEAALLFCLVGGKCSDEQKKEFKEHHPEMGDDVPIRAYPSSDQAIAMFKGSSNIEPEAFEVAPFFKEDFEEMNEDADSETSTVPTRKNKKTAKAVTESFL